LRNCTAFTFIQVTSSLATLMQYRLLKFNALSTNESVAEYTLLQDKILLILRYSRFVYFIQKKYGNPSSLLLDEILKSGMQLAESIIITAYSHSAVKNNAMLTEFCSAFTDLVANQYIIRCPDATDDAVPELRVNEQTVFSFEEIDFKNLKSLVDSGVGFTSTSSNVYWAVNFDKLHQCFRDRIMIDAIERQIDSSAGECFQFIIQVMYKNTEPWAVTSNPISLNKIKQAIQKKSSNSQLVKYFEQYIAIIAKDECGFLRQANEFGQYTVNMNEAFQQLGWSTIENVITQKFGSKATRIFRIVRSRKFIEQADIQKEALMPAKEVRFLTYKLLEESFLQTHTIKKSGIGLAGLAKTFFLFYINQKQVM